MRFARYGVELARLTRADVETVRQWRNSDWVRPYSRFQRLIEPAEQQRWFDRLDPACDWYFCARQGGAPFALFDVKAVDWTVRRGEAGGFVGDPSFIGRPEPALATLALMDFAFFVLDLHALDARYRADLRRIVRFNEQLGYEVVERTVDGFLRARISRERYLSLAAPFRHAAARRQGRDAVLTAPGEWLSAHLAVGSPASGRDFDLVQR